MAEETALSDEFRAQARAAYDRVLAKVGPRLIEPFEAYDHVEIDGTLGLFGSGGSARSEATTSKGERNFIFKGFGANPPLHLFITGSDNVAFIGPYCDVGSAMVAFIGSGGAVCIGAMTDIVAAKITAQGAGTSVVLGERCYVGEGAVIYNSDGHGIYSRSTGERINVERDIVVGDHVYIGHDVLVNKGAQIESDVMVLEKSVVAGRLERGCAYHGIPAVKVETDVAWARYAADAADLETARRIEGAAVAEKTARLRGRIAALGAAA